MKKKLILFVLLSSIITCCSAFSSCSAKSLETPIVKYNKGELSWTDVKGADKYELSINDNIITIYSNTYSIPVTLIPLNYTVAVKAIKESPYRVSEFSKKISFETYMLPNVQLGKWEYNTDSSEVNIPVEYTGTRCKFYINDCLDEDAVYPPFKLNNSQVNIGTNTIKIESFCYDVNICSSFPELLTVYRNPEFDKIEIKDGDIIGTISGNEYVCDTTLFPAGKSTQLIKNAMPSDCDITLSSTGKEFAINKLPPAVIESFSANNSYNTTITIALHYDGIDYDKIQLSRKLIDESNPVSAESVIRQDNQIICTFTFGYSPINYDSYYYTLIVKKNGYVKSSISYKP